MPSDTRPVRAWAAHIAVARPNRPNELGEAISAQHTNAKRPRQAQEPAEGDFSEQVRPEAVNTPVVVMELPGIKPGSYDVEPSGLRAQSA